MSRAYCPNVYTVAKGKYSAQLIADTKILLKLLVLYLPLPIYWALFDQQVSIYSIRSFKRYYLIDIARAEVFSAWLGS